MLVLDQHHGPRHGRLGHAREGVQQRVHQGRVLVLFVCMLAGGRLSLFNAASLDQYVTGHLDYEQPKLMRMIAEGEMGMGNGLDDATIIAAV